MAYEIWNRRYTGSKFKLADWIFDLINRNCTGSSFCDIFAGTGIIAQHAIKKMQKVIVNDFLYSNEIIYKAFFLQDPFDIEKINEYKTQFQNINVLDIKDNYASMQISLPEFYPYYFGPFSREVYEYLSFFLSIGMITSDFTSIPISPADAVENCEVEDDEPDVAFDENYDNSDKYEREYYLTNIGVRYVEDKIWGIFSCVQQLKMKEFKAKINQLSLDSLLRYVYNKYPEETKNSIIADKYLKKS